MRKKLKFPLEMEDGVQVRTLEELRNNFNLEKVVGYFLQGKLDTWLKDRYYEDEAEKISKLDSNSEMLEGDICDIFGVEYCDDKIDIEIMKQKNEKIIKLKQISDNPEYIKKIDSIAFDQEDLADLLDEGANPIYLCGKSFSISLSICNMNYIGINNPNVVFSSKEPFDLKEKNIVVSGVKMDEQVNCNINNSEQIARNKKLSQIDNLITLINDIPKIGMYVSTVDFLVAYSVVDSSKEFSTQGAARNYAQDAISNYVSYLGKVFNVKSKQICDLIKKYYDFIDNVYFQLGQIDLGSDGRNAEEYKRIKNNIYDMVGNILASGNYSIFNLDEYYNDIEITDNGESSIFHRKYSARYFMGIDNEFNERINSFTLQIFNYTKKLLEVIVNRLIEKRNSL